MEKELSSNYPNLEEVLDKDILEAYEQYIKLTTYSKILIDRQNNDAKFAALNRDASFKLGF